MIRRMIRFLPPPYSQMHSTSSPLDAVTAGHTWSTVPPPADGPGRMRPDIVGPQFTTSLAVATISRVVGNAC